jgi:hypothetical protein
MTEQKHFSYEGKVHVNDVRKESASKITAEVKSVEFLTPAKLTLLVNGEEKTFMVNIDIINKKVYDERGDDALSGLVFDYLDAINTLPEDFFAAPDEIYDVVEKVEAERESMRQQAELLGETNE